MIKKKTNVKLLAIVALCAAFVMVACCGSSDSKGFGDDDQQIFIGKDIAVAKTEYGSVRGFIIRGVYNFRGVPYGAETSGTNRFMPPQKPQAWSDTLATVAYGASAPQSMYDRRPTSYGMFVDHWNYDMLDEDCLRLNVWTPQIADDKKRPVLVWLHGGGFARGNGIEQDSYDGENIARSGDIVYVSINHRLNAFGFSDLSKVGGEKYKNSGNVGMLDIIAALQWVNKNIANFGGDPNNVTIMGQSGGGSKVCTVASMPAAKGLVHKGVALSGSSVGANKKEYAEELGEWILAEAGLKAREVDKLQQMPWQEYFSIAERAAAKLRAAHNEHGRGWFNPVADGVNIPSGTFFAAEDDSIPDIPMIFCTTFHEWNPNRDNPELENITTDELTEKLQYAYGERSAEIVKAYSELFSEAKPIEIWALIASNRQGVVNSANTKLSQKSPVYMAWFGWGSPLFDGRHRAFHCIDIAFWFKNTDLMITHTGGGKKPRKLADKMASSLINFMYTGDPNTDKLPTWPQYTKETGETMILNNVCEMKNDPDGKARAALDKSK